jgi:uncharacterized protein YoaH (UPF0181 family)
MTLIDPKGWQPLANQLDELLNNGHSLGEALRAVAVRDDASVMLLMHAVQEVCKVSSKEAAKVVAHEVTTR